ncbi:MAG TPA: DUF1080 domain-containing protein, partial [Bacteroidales bacterium]|nr:DUF1080 domain-containing protein [Bacteroidales bacterium]
MKKVNILAILMAVCSIASGQKIDPAATELWEPVPPVVTPGENGAPPSDAIVLFDGKNLDMWESERGGPARWEVKDGILTIVPGTGGIKTKKPFGDCQLHIEWRSPAKVEGDGQNRGNSGVF